MYLYFLFIMIFFTNKLKLFIIFDTTIITFMIYIFIIIFLRYFKISIKIFFLNIQNTLIILNDINLEYIFVFHRVCNIKINFLFFHFYKKFLKPHL